MSSSNKIKEMQSKYVIQFLMEDNNIGLAKASMIWYNSKTKKLMLDSNDDYLHISPARCYDELLMELSNNPRWMKGQFD